MDLCCQNSSPTPQWLTETSPPEGSTSSPNGATSWGPSVLFTLKPHCHLEAHTHPSPELSYLAALSWSTLTLDSLALASSLPLYCSGQHTLWKLVGSIFGDGLCT